MNHLYYGNNLYVLRDSIAAESIDLVYLDPPFNSKREYNLLFKTPKGHESEAQIGTFDDSWHWGEQAESEFDELLHQPNTDVAEIIKAESWTVAGASWQKGKTARNDSRLRSPNPAPH